jgi:hypothetical protein
MGGGLLGDAFTRGRRASAMTDLQIPRNEIQAGWNKFQIPRNEIQILIPNRAFSRGYDDPRGLFSFFRFLPWGGCGSVGLFARVVCHSFFFVSSSSGFMKQAKGWRRFDDRGFSSL